MNKLVEQTVRDCIPCQSSTPSSQRDPVEPTPLPKGPWENLSIDFAGPFPNGKYLLVLLHDYSRFPMVEVVPSTNADSTTDVLRRIFAQIGVPHQVKSDNGPPFTSTNFRLFALEYGFKHHRITPLWPEANGEAERFMRTLTKAIKALNVQGRDWVKGIDDFLMCYRATPHATTRKSPYELLFGRQMQTALPRPAPEPEAHDDKEVRQDDLTAKLKSKAYADKRRHTKPHMLKQGD
ncbi:hypothetical protein MTO96_041641 [Rhipicephalus appendiculatus]